MLKMYKTTYTTYFLFSCEHTSPYFTAASVFLGLEGNCLHEIPSINATSWHISSTSCTRECISSALRLASFKSRRLMQPQA